MSAHSDRHHARWSASATAANWTCAGRMAMVSIAPDQKDSIYAAEGTAAHEISEKALRGDKNCHSYIGDVLKVGDFDIEITEEIADSAQTYVDYVTEQSKDALLFLEERYTLDDLDPPFEAGGTCDAVILNANSGILEVVDLKHGKGIVDVGCRCGGNDAVHHRRWERGVHCDPVGQVRGLGRGEVLNQPSEQMAVAGQIVANQRNERCQSGCAARGQASGQEAHGRTRCVRMQKVMHDVRM